MNTIKVKGKTVRYYDSIEELPVQRFHKFNKYLLIDSGIGSDLNDIDNHIYKILAFINAKDTESAKREVLNLRQNLYFVSQEINLRHASFMVLIESIDGKPNNDLSEEGIQRTLKLFENEKRGFLESLIDGVKKKLKRN